MIRQRVSLKQGSAAEHTSPATPLRPGAARRIRRKPGPADLGDSYRSILDAAEVLFASGSFAATSMRAIAEEAGLAQSLLHYHFGTKEKLFQAMFDRRSKHMNDLRLERLARLTEVGTPTLEQLLEVLLRPPIESGRDGAGNTVYFSRLMLVTALSSEKHNKELIQQNYDPFARKYVTALRSVMPQLSKAKAVWGYLFAIGVAMTFMAPTGRANRLSDGLCDDSDTEVLLDRVIEFAAAGLRAFSQAETEATKPLGRKPRIKPAS